MSPPAARHPDNPVRGRLNAALFRWLDGYAHRRYAERKRALFAGLPDTVVELGPGVGANFHYLRPGTRVIAVEPNRHMHAGLIAAARRHGVQLEIEANGAEALAMPAGSAPAVIATLVLCTVADPRAVLREVHRVLVPGGRFVAIEHVAAGPGSFVAWVQRLLFRPWRWLFEGCHTTRDTATLIAEAGFAQVQVDHFTLATAFIPIRSQIAVTAIR